MRHSAYIHSIILMLLFVTFSCRPSSGGGTRGGIMNWKERQIDLGKFPHNEVRQTVFRFKNVGDRPLVIHNVDPSCGCMAADYTKSPVAPGDSGTVTVSYSGVSQHAGRFDKHLTVISSDTTQYNIIRISGETYDEGDDALSDAGDDGDSDR